MADSVLGSTGAESTTYLRGLGTGNNDRYLGTTKAARAIKHGGVAESYVAAPKKGQWLTANDITDSLRGKRTEQKA